MYGGGILMKKMKESNRKKLCIKLPNITLVTRVSSGTNLEKGDIIKIRIGKIKIYAEVQTPQYQNKKNLLQIDVKEVNGVDDTKVKEVFMV